MYIARAQLKTIKIFWTCSTWILKSIQTNVIYAEVVTGYLHNFSRLNKCNEWKAVTKYIQSAVGGGKVNTSRPKFIVFATHRY